MDNIKRCPFCGSRVDLMHIVTPMDMFYCSNYKECGAVISFNNYLCDHEAGNRHKIRCFNRRADNGQTT